MRFRKSNDGDIATRPFCTEYDKKQYKKSCVPNLKETPAQALQVAIAFKDGLKDNNWTAILFKSQ